MWGEKYPDFMDALMPTAAQPTEVAGRNWMLRRMVIDFIRNDPEWNGGNYTQQPRSLKLAQMYFGVATSGGTQAIHRAAPTREKADQILDQRLAQASNADANDVIYQMEASRDYNPAPLAREHSGAVAGHEFGRRRTQSRRSWASWSAKSSA